MRERERAEKNREKGREKEGRGGFFRGDVPLLESEKSKEVWCERGRIRYSKRKA